MRLILATVNSIVLYIREEEDVLEARLVGNLEVVNDRGLIGLLRSRRDSRKDE
jgi:hypothetical protein